MAESAKKSACTAEVLLALSYLAKVKLQQGSGEQGCRFHETSGWVVGGRVGLWHMIHRSTHPRFCDSFLRFARSALAPRTSMPTSWRGHSILRKKSCHKSEGAWTYGIRSFGGDIERTHGASRTRAQNPRDWVD